jgi:hypothetical protein
MSQRPARKSKTPSRYDVFASLSDDDEPVTKPIAKRRAGDVDPRDHASPSTAGAAPAYAGFRMFLADFKLIWYCYYFLLRRPAAAAAVAAQPHAPPATSFPASSPLPAADVVAIETAPPAAPAVAVDALEVRAVAMVDPAGAAPVAAAPDAAAAVDPVPQQQQRRRRRVGNAGGGNVVVDVAVAARALQAAVAVALRAGPAAVARARANDHVLARLDAIRGVHPEWPVHSGYPGDWPPNTGQGPPLTHWQDFWYRSRDNPFGQLLYDRLWADAAAHRVLRDLYPHVIRHFYTEYYYFIVRLQPNPDWRRFRLFFANGVLHWQGIHDSRYCRRGQDCLNEGMLPRNDPCIPLLQRTMTTVYQALQAAPNHWTASW